MKGLIQKLKCLWKKPVTVFGTASQMAQQMYNTLRNTESHPKESITIWKVTHSNGGDGGGWGEGLSTLTNTDMHRHSSVLLFKESVKKQKKGQKAHQQAYRNIV